jgi:predicted ABC-type exoprotein transport system permease subunit
MDINNTIIMLKNMGVFDFLLPFILVFTIIFAITKRVNLFKDNEKFRTIISLIMGLLFVVPHYTGGYPLGYDPVLVINQSIPSIGILAVAIVMTLMVMGLFGREYGEGLAPYLAILGVIFVGYIFGSSLNWWNGPSNIFYWWTDQLTELLIIIIIFGVIIWFITGSGGKNKTKDNLKKIHEGVKTLFPKQP